MRWRLYLGVILAVIVGLVSLSAYKLLTPKYLKTEMFVITHMTNPNGTLATYLSETPNLQPDVAHGREALSEALGLWLQYSVEKKDRASFDRHYSVLKKFFIAPQGFVYWKISADGSAHVSTNALVDDLRIIDALYSAALLWNNAEYNTTANEIGQYNALHLVKEGLLTDFFDVNYKNSPDSLTLSYLDVHSIDHLRKNGILTNSVAENSIELLKQLPNDGVFYPQSYDLKKRLFSYTPSINMIDQLLVAIQRERLGIQSAELFSFLKREFYQRGVISGDYSRQTRESTGSFESPAVYALVILYSIDVGDRQFAIDVYQRMIRFRQAEGVYSGGYVYGSETHIFDNLYPQIAELNMYKAYPFYFILH